MSDNRESYHLEDRFSEYFRQRLKTYPVMPDEDCWGEIETRLQKKRGFSSLWLGVSIAASVLVAVFVFHHLPEKKDREGEELLAYPKEDSVECLVTGKEKPEEKLFVADKGGTVAMDRQRIPAAERTAEKQMPDKVDEAGTEADVDSRGDVIIRETPVVTDEQPDIKKENEPDETSGVVPEKQYRTFENRTAYNMPPDKNKRNRSQGWQIAAGFSSISAFSSLDPFSNKDMMVNDPVLTPDYGSENGNHPGKGNDEDPEELSTERITEVKPLIPFSAGIMIRRKWNKTLGIETGLVYTRLSSDLIVEGSYNAVLNLHYLGVPVNLTVNLWEKDRFCLYASGGGMVEKGIRSVYKQKMPLWNTIIIKDKISRISGLQWSLNGGIGISYNFYKEMNLYIEPGISYYFDNNQPVSRRTEDPLSFSFRLGIRYDF